MNGKQTVWIVIGGASLLTGYRALTTGNDPIPQWAGIGASGIILLFIAEPFPKFAASLAVLLGVTLALNWDAVDRISGGGVRTGNNNPPAVQPSGPR